VAGTGVAGMTPRRATYRHGDLRRALLDAGTTLARRAGPEAVVLREATRMAGVAPNAAYRHFADRQALLAAVSAAAMAALADAIEAELAEVKASGPKRRARARLRAVGVGYVRFARAEPGLFRTAFSVPADMATATDPAKAGATSLLTPFQLLGGTLDELVAAGAMPVARRPGAEFLAWSAVHGLAMLLIGGPLRAVDETGVAAVVDRLVGMVERGL